MCSCLLLSKNGTSLIPVLLVMATISFSSVVILKFGSQKRKVAQQLNVSVSANAIKQKLVGIVISPQSWQMTQTKNSSAFSTFNPNNPPKLNLYTPESAGTAYYQSTNDQAGFDLLGNPCSQFSANGNDECPFRYVITLKNRVLQNGNWIDTLHFELSFKPLSTNLVLNATSPVYSFDLTRNLNDQSVESACISVNGQYNSTTNSCSTKITKTSSICSNGHTYRGPASNNVDSNCETKAVTVTNCGGGSVIKGFNPQGAPICGTALGANP